MGERSRLPVNTWNLLTVMQRQTAVTAYFSSKQLLLFAFALGLPGSSFFPCVSDNAWFFVRRLMRRIYCGHLRNSHVDIFMRNPTDGEHSTHI